MKWSAAREKGTAIARRSPQSICQKIYEGHAVIVVMCSGEWAVLTGTMCGALKNFQSGKVNETLSYYKILPRFGIEFLLRQKFFEENLINQLLTIDGRC